jgi:hypothetical protein
VGYQKVAHLARWQFPGAEEVSLNDREFAGFSHEVFGDFANPAPDGVGVDTR